jgi:hypothetical protein
VATDISHTELTLVGWRLADDQYSGEFRICALIDVDHVRETVYFFISARQFIDARHSTDFIFEQAKQVILWRRIEAQ